MVTSPSTSSRKKLSHCQIILSSTCSAWSLSSSVNSENSSVAYCRFLQRWLSISTVPRCRLAPRPLPLVPAPHERLAPCGRRRRAGGGAPPRDRRQRRLCGRQRGAAQTAPPSAAQATGDRRVATNSPVRAATLVVNRWARSALSAAVVPVRPPHRGPAPLRQDQPGLAEERHQ